MLVLVTYDITDDRRRSGVSRELENFGMRVQRSVFECYLDTAQLKELKARLEHRIDLAEDHIRFYSICRKDAGKMEIEGNGIIYRDDDYFVV